MSSWGNNDNAANAPYWAVNSTIAHAADVSTKFAAPTAANVAQLYGNTTSGVYIAGETVGLFGVNAQESAVDGHTHTGWVLRTTGSGGRAGRVQEEVLVALNNFVGADGDAQVYANVSITLSGPSNATVTAGSANTNTATFSVSSTLTGNTAAALTYLWQVNNGAPDGTWVDMANGNNPQPAGVRKSGVTSDTLSIKPWNTTANNYLVRAKVMAADEGVTVYSSNAVITIM
jgi:hypothetical protein